LHALISLAEPRPRTDVPAHGKPHRLRRARRRPHRHQEWIAEARIMIEDARLLTLNTVWMMDQYGNKAGRPEIAMIKVAAPNMACRVIDWTIQAFGGTGVAGDYGFAYATAPVFGLAHGPDEVHRNLIAHPRTAQIPGHGVPHRGSSVEVLLAAPSPGFRQRPVWIA
jgi:hypothetical protein